MVLEKDLGHLGGDADLNLAVDVVEGDEGSCLKDLGGSAVKNEVNGLVDGVRSVSVRSGGGSPDDDLVEQAADPVVRMRGQGGEGRVRPRVCKEGAS